MKIYRCPIRVRGYELDSFGHVNHAVYLNYLEHARWEMLYEEEITLEKFRNWQRWPVIASVELQYLRPTFISDQLEVRTHVTDHERTQFHFSQEIYRGETVVLKAKIRAVMVNERGRPAETPEEISRLWAKRKHETN